jgi:hypothetical protein
VAISVFDIVVPTFDRRLQALSTVLDKAAAYAEARKIEPSALINDRLFPDMFPLWLQVQAACSHAGNVMARLSGAPLPNFGDMEKTFDGLKARIAVALEAIHSVAPAALTGSEDRTITMMSAGRERQLSGIDYVLNSGLPNFYFHVTTAYAILRHNGVEIGKRDFIG